MRTFLLLCAVLGEASAQNHYDILGYLGARRYTYFLNYLKTTGVDATLNGTGPFTVFAASNTYLYRLSKNITGDTAKLKDLMKFQVVNGNYTRPKLMINELQLPTLQGSKIRINYYYNSRGVMLAEGQRIYSGYNVSNGVIYFMNGLLTPPVGTVLDILVSNANFSTLHTAVTAAGLENFFQDQSPITLFAPTDNAFNYLGQDKLQALVHNPALLASVLKYHVIPGTLYAAGYHNDYLHTFEQADRLRLDRYLSGGYEVEGDLISSTELSATNGVVHMIDQVLIPSSLMQQINALTV